MPKKRVSRPRGGENLEAFEYRKYITRYEYQNKCKYPGEGFEDWTPEAFKRRFPTSLHYLYTINTFWLYHDLLLTTPEQKKQVNFIKHWEIAQKIDRGIAVCALKHTMAGEIEQLRDFNEADHFLIEVSRDTYKTTLVLAGHIRILGVYPDWTNAFIRSKAEDAYDGIRYITSHLLTNGNLHEYFPKLEIDRKEIKRKQLQFSRKAIGLPVDTEVKEEVEYAIKRTHSPEPNLEAIGLDVTYTGKHKNGFISIDDAVTEKNYGSKQIQDRMWGRLAELSNVASWQAVFSYSQTPYADYDVFQRKKNVLIQLQEEEDKKGTGVKIYEHYRQPLLETKEIDPETNEPYKPAKLLSFILNPKDKFQKSLGEKSIIFPERHTSRSIKRKYLESPSPRFFHSQYLLEIIPDSERIFKDEWLMYYGENTVIGRQPSRDTMRVVAIIDPSGSVDENSDEVGILVTGIDDDKFMWLLEDVQERMTSKKLMDIICGLHDIYQPDEWYMETFASENKYRGLIQQIINYRLNQNNYSITILPIKGKTQAGAKYDRIEGSTLPFEMRRVYVNERHANFLRQYAEWRRPTPAGLPDHLLDCFGYLTQMIYPSGMREKDYNFDRKHVVTTAFDLAPLEVRSIKMENYRQAKRTKALCPECMTLRPAVNGVCDICGTELWLGYNSRKNAIMVG
uniref:Putative terminase n=1 Tax=viral metagenome TaxID=1070528 RepID=A0A6H1ZIC1_9ZZZZ